VLYVVNVGSPIDSNNIISIILPDKKKTTKIVIMGYSKKLSRINTGNLHREPKFHMAYPSLQNKYYISKSILSKM